VIGQDQPAPDAQKRLDDSEGYVTVFFSPWRYEAYEDVKAALMDTILKRLERRSRRGDREEEQPNQAAWHGCPNESGLDRGGQVARGRAMTYGAAHAGLPPAMVAPAGAALVAGATAAEQTPQVSDDDAAQTVEDSVTKFRQEFKQLLDSLEDVKAVVVFIDDLDRCLDETVIYVFEAIRLFLQVHRPPSFWPLTGASSRPHRPTLSGGPRGRHSSR